MFAAAATAKSLQSCQTLCDPRDGSPPDSPLPDSLGKSARVGCHFLLQCMKVKSESEVAQSCLTLSDPMNCSPPGSSTHGIFQARVLEWGAIAFSAVPLEVNIKMLRGHNSVHSRTEYQTQKSAWSTAFLLLMFYLQSTLYVYKSFCWALSYLFNVYKDLDHMKKIEKTVQKTMTKKSLPTPFSTWT